MRSLHESGHLLSRRFFAVVEWQRNTLQPHWHVLVESRFVPHELILNVWGSFRPRTAPRPEPGRPGVGFAWISRSDFADAEHAANYASKYLRKHPEHGFPAWVMQSKKRIRRYTTSRGFWQQTYPPRVPSEETRKLEVISYEERIGRCGDAVNLFVAVETIDYDSGEVITKRQYADTIKLDAGRWLRRWIDAGGLRGLRLDQALLRWLYQQEGFDRRPGSRFEMAVHLAGVKCVEVN